MTHSYEDIIRLDSERTQGTISVKETSDKRLSLLVINNGSFPDKVSTQLFINDASYFAAMPDAVGLLKRYRIALLKDLEGFKEANRVSGMGLDCADERITELQQLLQEEQKG